MTTTSGTPYSAVGTNSFPYPTNVPVAITIEKTQANNLLTLFAGFFIYTPPIIFINYTIYLHLCKFISYISYLSLDTIDDGGPYLTVGGGPYFDPSPQPTNVPAAMVTEKNQAKNL